MTTAPDTLLLELDALQHRAAADPAITTSTTRTERLRTVVAMLKRATADCEPHQLATLTDLLADTTIGHPSNPASLLGRAAAGAYRTRPNGRPLTPATTRALMDGLADLNHAAGHPPYWWQQRGQRPWSKHTRTPLQPDGHRALRRALSIPYGDTRRERFRLRQLAVLELLWDTGVEPYGLSRADTTDLAPDCSHITLRFDPPGRTEATVRTVPLGRTARAALRLWLPARRQVVAEHLVAGPDHPANQALFVTLRHTTGTYDDGRPRQIPPGLRISDDGLATSYSAAARRLNEEHHGEPGWPVPTNFYLITRGGAAAEPPATGS
ncbi:hypothetical protein [Kitasatospora sp. NPDC004272]